MIVDEEVYLEHFGKKGMHWGVRSVKAVGRGAKKTGRFIKNHPKTSASIAAGATFAAVILGKKITGKIASNNAIKMNSEHFKRLEQSGIAWRTSKNAPWNYGQQMTPGPYSNKWNNPNIPKDFEEKLAKILKK